MGDGSMPARLWLTYSWADNRDQEVEFIAQQLESENVTVLLDRWEIRPGRRLWHQIAAFITDSASSDAWAIYATTNSLGSEPCQEEMAYALDRALRQRGMAFPIIGLLPSSISP